jgi:diguanylate cyclase (GGDEF)-like protein
MLDIDYFKRFNDSYGHIAGDALLRAVGGFLSSHIRRNDVACRYGGEEFALILLNASLQETLQRAETLRVGIHALNITHEDLPLPAITVSLGVATMPEYGSTAESVLKAADDALYHAKESGRNQVVVASSVVQTTETENHT